MKRIKSKINIIYIFGIVFILAGLVSIVSEASNIYCLTTSKYKEVVESNVISVEVEEEDYFIDSHERGVRVSDSKFWVTKEEIEINGNILSYQGRYSSYPGGTIKHTIISNDGINWDVNDSDKYSLFINVFIGTLCTLVGLGIVIYEKKKQQKKKLNKNN